MLMRPVTFKIKACDLTRSWTSKARDLKSRLLEFFRSSEKTAPWVITIRPLSTAGSSAPGHTNNNTLINNVSDGHPISLSKQNLPITFRLQADRWNYNQSDTTEKKKRRHDDEEKLQRRQLASHADSCNTWSIHQSIGASISQSDCHKINCHDWSQPEKLSWNWLTCWILNESSCDRLQISSSVSSVFFTNRLVSESDVWSAFIELEMTNGLLSIQQLIIKR